MKPELGRIRVIICAVASLFSCAASAALGADHNCALSYETFETAIPHLDAEDCPDKAMAETAFCRISVGGDQAHVFYFSNEDKQCLLKVESYDDDDMSITINKR